MKNKKRILILIAALICVTAILTVLHLNTRKTPAEAGGLLVRSGETSVTIVPSQLSFTAVTGTILNGKGEEKAVSGQGVPLKDVAAAAGFTISESMTVTAADEFSATVTLAELDEEGKVWLLRNEDDTYQLIVFGDPNSKRAVRGVQRIEVK